MVMRYLALWFGFTLCGCISSGAVTSQLDSWNGQSRNAVEKSWGKWDKSDANSYVFIANDAGVYSSSTNYLDSGASDVIQTHDGACKVVFIFGANNKVQQSSWSGSLGRCYQYTSKRTN